MKNLSIVAVLSLISLPNLSYAQVLGDDNCDSLLLVSSWTRNNVKIYDGCSGEYIKNLDSQGLIDGPLGILEAPDGDVLVISENNGRMLKFDRETLSIGSILLGPGGGNDYIPNPISAVIDEQGMMYAASFTQNKVVKIDTQTWQITETILRAGNSLIDGIDVGIVIEDGSLYLPGWKSDNIVKVDLTTKQATEVVKPRAGGLSRPRSILFNQNDMLVSSENSDAVLVFEKDNGTYKSKSATVSSPSGMINDGDGYYLVTAGNSVYRKAIDGSSSQLVIQPGAGSLAGATFVYRLAKTGMDSDNDGLTNEDEVIYGTDTNNPDTDSDTLSDGDEVHTYLTNPLVADTDTDGMPDGYETSHQLDPLVNDSEEDKDDDGLTNINEMLAGTDPNNSDTDGDGILDGADSNPLIDNSAPEISGFPESEIMEDQSYSFEPTVSYLGNIDSIVFSISNQPSWTDFNDNTGALIGSPENDDVGEYKDIVIQASNNAYDDKLEAFSIVVKNVNDVPVLSSNIPAQSLNVDSLFNFDASSYFTDVDQNDTLTFSVENLPSGLDISPQGVITGSTSTAGSYSIEIIATDTENLMVQGNFNLTVSEKSEPASTSTSSGGAIYGLLVLLFLGLRRSK
ncbi:MAG: putative Ig domain-containing protein [Colwellia sp.]|nr:putative Ig domain-containing protein [Colwellia sp.]